METEKSDSVEQQAYKRIKGQIMNLELKPGQMLNDLDVAKEMGISRTPVRDAFRQLEFEGLLNNLPRRGWMVSPLRLEDIREIFMIKETLQGMLARQAANNQNETLRAELKQIVASMEESSDIAGSDWWDQAHARFHELIFELSDCPNGRTRIILDQLNAQWRRVRKGLFTLEGYRVRELQDHTLIGQAILAGDADQAEALMRAHLVRVREELLHLLENLVFPFVTHGV
jgi:DNA-binding GntR family transcriptional regulator